MDQHHIKDFDPWTATEKEASALFDIERPCLSKYCQWVVVQYAKEAEAYANENGASAFCELDLLKLVCKLTENSLVVPGWLSEELVKRVDPIIRGETKDFSNWKTGTTKAQREKAEAEYYGVIYSTVTRLLLTGDYVTTQEASNNVFEKAAELVGEEIGWFVSASTIKQAWRTYRNLLKKDGLLESTERFFRANQIHVEYPKD